MNSGAPERDYEALRRGGPRPDGRGRGSGGPLGAPALGRAAGDWAVEPGRFEARIGRRVGDLRLATVDVEG